MTDKKTAIKVAGCLLTVSVTAGILFFLSHSIGQIHQTEDRLPPLYDSPSYVELTDGESLRVVLEATEDCTIGSLKAVLVNLEENGGGTVSFSMSAPSGENLWQDVSVNEADIPIGEWTLIGTPAFNVQKGEEYVLTVTANGCSPYFIKTQLKATNASLPFNEIVYGGDTTLDSGVSLGMEEVSDKALTFGDVFYYSYPIAILLAILVILLIIFGPAGLSDRLRQIPVLKFFSAYGNDIFLVILFVTLSLSIYVYGYLDSVNISADSAGYLREAVNIAAGNGFRYDGLAGYKDSWFANWPILYPAMIAGVMKVSGLAVYQASKLLSVILVGALIIVLRAVYRKDAWIYALCMTNTGLLSLYWYSWSELPFILFMLLFSLALTGIVTENNPGIRHWVFLGLSTVLCFLTRYFGLFLFAVLALYLLILFINEKLSRRVIGVAVTSLVSGFCCMAYLFMNKRMNGMPSGVSRSMWWDDYGSLTNDLIKSLLTEFFNVFHLEMPAFISRLEYSKSVLILFLIIFLLAAFVIRNVKSNTRESVLIVTAVIYYVLFIVIRYFSSMDTFYFRFFAPATFLLSLGIAGLLIQRYRGSSAFRYLAGTVTVLLLASSMGMIGDHITKTNLPYYEVIESSWENDYEEIPDHSVVIFSTLDYRSLFYRCDVVEGSIDPQDTMDTLKERYHGSSNMCILSEDASAMLESGIYDVSVNRSISDNLDPDKKYCVIGLK